MSTINFPNNPTTNDEYTFEGKSWIFNGKGWKSKPETNIAWSTITGVPSTFTPSAHNQAWSTITSTPTTLVGYGITDAVSELDPQLGVIYDLSLPGPALTCGSEVWTFASDVYRDNLRTVMGLNNGKIIIEIDGKDAVLTTGAIKGQVIVPYNCTITGWELVANESGSVVVDIWKDTYANFPPTNADSITGSAKPTLTASQKADSTTLTGWTTALSAGDYIKIEIESATSVTFLTLTLSVTRT